jgi:hypothetical protein
MAQQFKITILRNWQTDDATFGEMYVNGQLITLTLERPWLNNQQGKSSIPEGNYGAILRYDHEKYHNFTIQFTGTEPRSFIQIHIGNRPDQTEGCVLVGMKAKYQEKTIAESESALLALKKIFYNTEEPISCPDLEIRISVKSLPLPLRFYASQTDKSYSWVFEDAFWFSQGGETTTKYKEVLRDTKWIINRTENSGAFAGSYVRWGTLGNTAFQISSDLKNWAALAPDELLQRSPLVDTLLWSVLKENGGSLKILSNSKAFKKPVAGNAAAIMQTSNDGEEDTKTDPRNEYNDDDSAHSLDHWIILDFGDGMDDAPFDGDTVEIPEPDIVDDYSKEL